MILSPMCAMLEVSRCDNDLAPPASKAVTNLSNHAMSTRFFSHSNPSAFRARLTAVQQRVLAIHACIVWT